MNTQKMPRDHIEKIVLLNDDEYAFILSHFTAKKFKKLEEDGLIIRHSYIKKPPRVEYELSELSNTDPGIEGNA